MWLLVHVTVTSGMFGREPDTVGEYLGAVWEDGGVCTINGKTDTVLLQCT